MEVTVRMLPVLFLIVAACVPKSVVHRIETLEGQVNSLETEVAALKAARPTTATRPTVDASLEQQAGEKLREAMTAVEALDFDTAKQLCAEGAARFGATHTWTRRGRVCQEVEVIGKAAAPLEVEFWFQGGAPPSSETQLLVFWEQWCPHCKREVPMIQELADRRAGELQVVALTKVNRSATDDKVRDFVDDNELRFAVGKERNGSMSRYYNVSGVPAAALVKNGMVIWRGHPAMLQRGDTLQRLLDGRGPSGNR